MERKTVALPTPYFVVDESLLIRNLEILREVADAAGCKILLAQKAFSMHAVYPLIRKYLDGSTASGIFEARLGWEEMGGETHVFSAAYTDQEFCEVLEICDHIVFNSFAQWERFRTRALNARKTCGIRVNPAHSTQDIAIYDPCAPASRLGVTVDQFRWDQLDGLEGIHFHTLCQQNSDALIETLEAVEAQFGHILGQMKWVNFGGGHHITRPDYDRKALIDTIIRFREQYDVTVYLEPGEAVALNAGFLHTQVLDIVDNGMQIAILDSSAVCHMPDVIEMPYRPPLESSALPGEKPYTYRLAGPTCLAGDIIGDYSFDAPLKVGDVLRFEDMAIYSMVKTNTFNGVPLPSIALLKQNGEMRVVKRFGYTDFKNRLS